jgi:NAD(P)H-nitrite reductase large subunit
VCKLTTENMRRVGDIDVVRPFVEEVNFRRFAESTKRLENYIDMNGLDHKTKEVIKYYQKLNNHEEDQEDESPILITQEEETVSYAQLLAELHRKSQLAL